jgi:hypothetical protein
MSVADIIREYCEPGETPFYVKIDLEGADKMVLQEILETGLIPQYLSVEIHDKDVVNLVLDCRFFESFRIETAGFPSKARDGRKFSRISAGPFGEDFVEFWLSRNAISILAKLKSQNARDIHASSIRMPCTRSTLSLFLQPSFYRKLTLSVLLQKPEIVRVLIRLITTKRIRDKGREVLANLYFVKQKKNANKSIINEFQRYTRTNKSSSKH